MPRIIRCHAVLHQLQHGIHGLRHGIQLRETIILEQGIEDGAGDDLLRQHLDGLRARDGGVDTVMQTLQKLLELLLPVPRLQELGDGGNLAFRNVRDVLGPVLPVATAAALLDDARKDGILPERQIPEKLLGRLFRRSETCCRSTLAVSLPAVAARNTHHPDRVGRLAVQLNLVNLRIEAVIVRTQGLQHIPHRRIFTLPVAQHLLRLLIARHPDGQQNIPVLLPRRRAHHAPHRLHDVDLRAHGGQEHHRIQRRHVHALGKAARVGQHTAFLRALFILQPSQGLIAPLRIHRAVHMLNAALQEVTGFPQGIQHLLKSLLHLLGDRNAPREGHGALHGVLVEEIPLLPRCHIRVQNALAQAVVAA